MGYLTGIYENEALLYLGYKGGEVPEEILSQVRRAERELLQLSRPRVTHRVFARKPDGTIEGLGFSFAGGDVKEMLKDCHTVILFGATLGNEIERYERSLQVRDLGYAFIFDACANSAIENVCDNFCEELGRTYGYMTDRFSPGYGDLPFETQWDFERVLQLPKRIGVCLAESGMMIPSKSVTAVLGAANCEQKKRFRGCAYCSRFRTCSLRKEGRVCGKF